MPPSSRVSGSNLSSITASVKSPPGSPVSSHLPEACRWVNGYIKLSQAVNGVVNVQVHGVLQWTGFLSSEYSHIPPSGIHHYPSQGQAVTEDERMISSACIFMVEFVSLNQQVIRVEF